ncbi:MAG: hypothetical protein KDB14_04280 [Planctomycetales bacterium]|nr:hypothetical protein [Planctomycetales bacterium]
MLPNPKVHLLCEAGDPFQANLNSASQGTGWMLETHSTADEFLRKLRLEHHGCLVVSPRRFGPEPAMEMIRGLREKWINLPILLAVSDNEPHALEVAAVHSGAHDVIRIPAADEQIRLQIARALEFDRHNAGQPGVVRSRLATLSPKEREVLDLALEGQNTNAMASILGVCYQTINKHRARIRLKMRSKCDITLMNHLLGQRPLPREVGYTSPAPHSPITTVPHQPAPISAPNHVSSPAAATRW